MSSITFFLVLIPVLGSVLLGVNFLLAPHTPYQEKNSVFECGFHSFLGQNRSQFSISFFIFGLLFLLFDLEILLIYPFGVTASINDIYGLSFMLIFFLLLTLGFVFELGKQALKIDSRQTTSYVKGVGLTSGILPKFLGIYIYKLRDKNIWIRIFTMFGMGLIVRILVNELFNVNIFLDYLNMYSLLAYFYIAIFNILISINFPIDILSSKKYQLQFKSRLFFRSFIKDLNITSFEFAKTGEDLEYKTKYVKNSSIYDSNLYKKNGINEENNQDNNNGQNLAGTSNSSENSQLNISDTTSNITPSTNVPTNKKRSYLTMVQLSGNDSVIIESNPRKKIKTNKIPLFAGGKDILNSSSSTNFPGDKNIINSKNVKNPVSKHNMQELTKQEKSLLDITTQNTTENTGVKKRACDINKEYNNLYNIYNIKLPPSKSYMDIDTFSSRPLISTSSSLVKQQELKARTSKPERVYRVNTWDSGASPERSRDILHIANKRAINKTLGTGADAWNFITDFPKNEIIKNFEESTPLHIGNKLVSDAINSKHMGHPENRDILNNMYSSLSGKSFYNESKPSGRNIFFNRPLHIAGYSSFNNEGLLIPRSIMPKINSSADILKIAFPSHSIDISTKTGWLTRNKYIPHISTGILKSNYVSIYNLGFYRENMKSLLAINAQSLVRNGNSLTVSSEDLLKNVKYLTTDVQLSLSKVKSITKNVKFIDQVVDDHYSLESKNNLDMANMEKFGVSESIEAIIADLSDPRMKKEWLVKDGLLTLTKKITMVHTPGWNANNSRSIQDSLTQPKEIDIGSVCYTDIFNKELFKNASICHGANLRELLQLFEYRWFSHSDVDALEQFNNLSSSEQLIILKLTSQVLENELITDMKKPQGGLNVSSKDYKHWSSGKFLNGNLTQQENKVISEYAIATGGTFPGITNYKYVFALLDYLSNKNSNQ